MKILIFGAGGMIGHKMYQHLSKSFPQTIACANHPFEKYEAYNLFDKKFFIENVDVSKNEQVNKILEETNPDVILNCVGITLRKEKIKDLDYCLTVNSLFPHILKSYVQENGKKLIHFSTDCVFDGSRSQYIESSAPSAKDVYGKTKYLGEVSGTNCLTLRGSMIGPELFGKTELLEWAIAQKGGKVKGFTKALYSGITTKKMAQLVEDILINHPGLDGLYQVSSPAISKFDLLHKINHQLGLGLTIEQDESYSTQKILSSEKLKKAINFDCPTWDEMLIDCL